jgi:hypothetical protein
MKMPDAALSLKFPRPELPAVELVEVRAFHVGDDMQTMTIARRFRTHCRGIGL